MEDYLQQFPGAVITVSHDRYFLDKVAEKQLIFNGKGQLEFYYGKISDYLDEQAQNVALKNQSTVKQEATPSP